LSSNNSDSADKKSHEKSNVIAIYAFAIGVFILVILSSAGFFIKLEWMQLVGLGFVTVLLFDIHCQGQYLSNRSEIEKDHELICVGHHDDLPQDMKDLDIAKYAKKHGYVVVTKDVDFVNLCKEEKIPVGVLKGNHLYLISDSIQMFGEKLPNRLFTSD